MATRENSKFTGIVFRSVPIKEKDAMVSCLGPNGFFSFFARGVMNPSSSEFASCQPLSQAEFVLNVSTQDALRLKEGKLLHSYRPKEDYAASLAVQSLIEILAKAVPTDDAAALYPYFEASLKAIETGSEPFTVLSVFLARTLVIEGYAPILDGCASCGKKGDIVAFSPLAGGLLCRECASELGEAKTPVELMRAIRAAFLCPESAIGTFAFSEATIRPLLSLLRTMTSESSGVDLKGIGTILAY